MLIYSYLTKLVAFIFSLFFCLTNANANNAIAFAVPNEGYPPYIIVNDSEVTGIIIEPIKIAAKNHGFQIEFHFLPEKRSARLIEQKQIDTRMESPSWVNQPEEYLWSDSIAQLEDIFIYNQSTHMQSETDAALKGFEVAAHLGYGYPTLEPLFKSGHLSRKDFATELDMLKSIAILRPTTKRVAVMNKNVAIWVLRKQPEILESLVFGKRVIDSAPLKYQFANTEKNQKIVTLVNQEIKRLREENLLEAIKERILNGN